MKIFYKFSLYNIDKTFENWRNLFKGFNAH